MARSLFFQFALVFFLPSQQRAIGLTRKYVSPQLFCCHDAISAWYFKAIYRWATCCLNVIPAGSFSLFLSLPPPSPSFFFSFPQFSRKWACSQANQYPKRGIYSYGLLSVVPPRFLTSSTTLFFFTTTDLPNWHQGAVCRLKDRLLVTRELKRSV